LYRSGVAIWLVLEESGPIRAGRPFDCCGRTRACL